MQNETRKYKPLYCSAWLRIYCGHYVQPAQSHRPCFETSGRSHLEQGHGAVCLSGAEPHPWPTFPHKVPLFQPLPHLPHSKLCPGEHPAHKTTPGLSEKQARSKRPAPKRVWGPTESILQMLVVTTRLRKFQMIQYLRDQEDTLHWVLPGGLWG